MSAASDDSHEHWPSEKKLWREPAVAAPGYDTNNGLHYHSYLPAKSKSPSPEKEPPPPPVPQVPAGAQPFYWPHYQPGNPQPQFFSHPPQAYYYPPNPSPQQYYTYATPPAQAPAPAPAPMAPQTQPEPAKVHVYHPVTSEPKSTAGAQPNVWLGRTKEQVEEDDMKIAKREGAYDKRKMAPADASDDQLFWVVELDGGPATLRDYRYIKTINGSWKKDPRFEDSYYFVREEEEKK